MATKATHRKLAAILSADVVGYSRLMASSLIVQSQLLHWIDLRWAGHWRAGAAGGFG
jgi:hypothetical protein